MTAAITVACIVAYIAVFIETMRRCTWYLEQRRDFYDEPALFIAFMISLVPVVGIAYLACVSGPDGQIGKPPRHIRQAEKSKTRSINRANKLKRSEREAARKDQELAELRRSNDLKALELGLIDKTEIEA
jgi:hypothetical protein